MEFDDVGGGRMVFLDGVRNVCAGEPRFSVAGAGVVFANGGEQWKHASDFVGTGGDGYGDRVARSVGVEADHRMGGQI